MASQERGENEGDRGRVGFKGAARTWELLMMRTTTMTTGAEEGAGEAEGGTTMMSMAMAMLMRMRMRMEHRDEAREMEMCDVRWKLLLTPAMTLTATNWASQGQT